MKLFFETKQQVAPRTCAGAKKFLGILLLPLLFTCASINLQAQTDWQIIGNNPSSGQPILGTLYNSQNPQALRFYTNGNQRGIFSQMLHVVDGNILISRTSNMGNRAPSSRNGSLLFGDDIDGNTQYGSWGIEYVNDPNHPEQGQGLNFWQPFGANHLSTTNYRLFLADDGKVGIGTQFPHAELSVNGTVLAKAVRVTTNATYWPDYVTSLTCRNRLTN